VVKDRNPDIPEQRLREEHGGWLDGNPYYLMIRAEPTHQIVQIDLGERGWMKKNARLMRAAGSWYLVRKSDNVIVAMMRVADGEQPYYTAKHVGYASVNDGGPKGETINYGIGKKRLDGHVDRVWVMANGCVTLGDDVESISLELLKQGLV
jgi:hypothetical protein